MSIEFHLMLVGLYLAFNRRCRPRLQLAIIIAAFQLAHKILFENAEHVSYFMSAGTIDFLTVCCLSWASSQTLSLSLQYVCASSVLFNLFGLILYWLRFEPTIYNNSIMTLTIIQSWLLLSGDGDYAGIKDFARRYLSAWRNRSYNRSYS